MPDILTTQNQTQVACEAAEKYARRLMQTDALGAADIQLAFQHMAQAIMELSEIVAAQQDEIQQLKNRNRPGYLEP